MDDNKAKRARFKETNKQNMYLNYFVDFPGGYSYIHHSHTPASE